MITCKSCGKEVTQSSRKGGRAKIWCNESCRAAWRYKNDSVIRDRNTYTDQKARAYKNKWNALQHKGGKCQECGESHPSKLCFHHRQPEKKMMNLDGRTFANRKWETLCEEVEKCDLLCHNCHNHLHNGLVWDEFLSHHTQV